MLHAPPVTLDIEDDLEDNEEPFSEQRLGIRLHDDLDEALAQPPPEKTGLELVDDLGEPGDLPPAEAPEMELHDDLHESVGHLPSTVKTHSIHEDLDDPVICPTTDQAINGRKLVDDLGEPAAICQAAHWEEMRFPGQLRDDLDDAQDTKNGSSPVGAGSNPGHLYDDLDELVVDELISEVSDLMLHGRSSSCKRWEQDRGQFSNLEAASANSAANRSSYTPGNPPLQAKTITFMAPTNQERKNTQHTCGNGPKLRLPEVQDKATQQKVDQTSALELLNSTSSGTTPTEAARDGIFRRKGSKRRHHVGVQMLREGPQETQGEDFTQISGTDSQKSRYSGTLQTMLGSNGARKPSCAVPAAGRIPALSMLPQSDETELQTMESCPRSARTSPERRSRQTYSAPVISHNDRVCHVQSRSCGFKRYLESKHSYAPASEPISKPPPSFLLRNNESPPSQPQSPLLVPSFSPPGSPSSPSSQSEDIMPSSPSPSLSRTPSQHEGPPRPTDGTRASQHEETSSLTIPVTLPARVAPLPLSCAIGSAPKPASTTTGTSPASASVTSSSSKLGTLNSAVRRPSVGSRGSQHPVQTETVLARIDAVLAAVTTYRQRGQTPELVLPARTRWQDLQLCSA